MIKNHRSEIEKVEMYEATETATIYWSIPRLNLRRTGENGASVMEVFVIRHAYTLKYFHALNYL